MLEDSAMIDPDLQGVLNDLACEGGSTLLRLTPRELEISALADMPSVSAGTAGWAPAEQHLIEHYRAELAELLVTACKLQASRGSATSLLDPRDEQATPEFVEQGAHSLLNSDLRSRVDEGAIELLSLLGGVSASGAPEGLIAPFQLIVAARRLVDSDRARTWHAIELVHHGSFEDSLTLSRACATPATQPSVRASAWSAIGLAQSMEGAAAAAADSYIQSASLDPEVSAYALWALLNAVDARDVNRTLLAARILDDGPSFEDGFVAEQISEHAAQGRNTPEQRARAPEFVLGALEDHLGFQSWKVINETAQSK